MKPPSKLRVLVVDDEGADTIAERLAHGLGPESSGDGEVLHARGVTEAFSMLAQETFDVIVVDMIMPNPQPGGKANEAGLLVLDWVQANNPTTQVLVLTAFGSHSNTLAAMQKGAFSYVDKNEEGWKILPIKVRLALERKRQLERQKKALLSDMAAKVIHDMRSPLTAIIGFAQMAALHAPESPAELSRQLAEIENCGLWMNEMATEVLDIVRDQAPPLRRTRVAFDEYLKSSEMLLKAIAGSKSVQLTIENSFQGTVWIDPDRIRRALANLVGNATRAVSERWSATGEGRIWIHVQDEQARLVIGIRDNGRGMSPEILAHIRERFIAGEIEDVPGYVKGYGIGLKVTREIVAQHNGTLEVDSEVDGGTTFTIRLALEDLQERD